MIKKSILFFGAEQLATKGKECFLAMEWQKLLRPPNLSLLISRKCSGTNCFILRLQRINIFSPSSQSQLSGKTLDFGAVFGNFALIYPFQTGKLEPDIGI